MITPSYNATATERVLPKLALDFTAASLDPRITFSRVGNTATVVNSSGLVAGINANIPRFDYNPVTLACNGLLIEEARTNICQYSEDFRNTAAAGSTRPWIYTASTIDYQPIGVNGPNGLAQVCKLTEDTATNTHYVSQVITNANANFTFSVFAKDAGRRYLRMMLADVGLTGGSRVYATFDLTNGTSTIGGITVTNQIATSQDFGNGWYKCSVSATITAGTSITTALVLSNTSGSSSTIPSYLGDGTSGVYLWGADVQEGLFPTSYIPNLSNSTTTRNADVATMTGTNFSNWFNQSAGTFVTSFFAPQADGGAPISGSSGSYWYLYRQNSTLLRSYDGTNALSTTVATMTPTTQLKVASSYSSTGRSQASGGGSVTSVATTYGAAGSSLLIGSRVSGVNYLNNCVSKIFYYPQRLTDAEVQAFSK